MSISKVSCVIHVSESSRAEAEGSCFRLSLHIHFKVTEGQKGIIEGHGNSGMKWDCILGKQL